MPSHSRALPCYVRRRALQFILRHGKSVGKLWGEERAIEAESKTKKLASTFCLLQIVQNSLFAGWGGGGGLSKVTKFQKKVV